MAGATSGKGAISSINVTPFVDIVLVLLVVLMVTAVQVVRGAIPVDLPTAASSGQAVETTLNIVITREGELFLDGQSITKDALAKATKSQVAANPKVQAVIAADKQVAYEKVIGAIDVIKLNGVKSFALNIEKAPPKSLPQTK